jgi:3-oxoadipate enol-lactonase
MTRAEAPSQDLINEFVGVSHGNVVRVKELLGQYPSLVNAVAAWGETPIQAAAQTGRRDIVELLLAAGAPQDICTSAMLGDLDAVATLLLRDGTAVRATGAHSLPVMYFPACNGRVDIAELLLAHGASINGGAGVSPPLHGAVMFGQPKMTEWLLNHGANVNALDYQKKSALQVALAGNRPDIADSIRSHGGRALASGFVEIESGRAYYESAGAGPAVVLIHAGVAHSGMWDEQFNTFSEHFRTIRYDLRGFGKTESPSGAFSFRQDLRDLLKALGVDRAAVVGLSMGGQIAVDFTLEHPEMVSVLIPVAAGLSGFDGGRSEVEAELMSQMEAADEQKDFDLLNELELRLWTDGPGQRPDRVASEVRERVREMNAVALGHHEEITSRRLDPPAAGRLGEIHVPTLVVVGDLDTRGVREACAALTNGIAGASQMVFPGVAHMVNLEMPEEFNRIVSNFLNNAK